MNPNAPLITALKQRKNDISVSLNKYIDKAIKSIEKHPIRINSGKEAKKLPNIGPKMANIIDNILQTMIKFDKDESNNIIMVHEPRVSNVHKNSFFERKKREPFSTFSETSHNIPDNHSNLDSIKHKSILEPLEATKLPLNKPKYLPKRGSGSYAILIALNNLNRDATKEEIIEEAQSYCVASFRILRSNKRMHGVRSAWSNINTLEKKELVKRIRIGRKHGFQLTKEGVKTARYLFNRYKDNSFAVEEEQDVDEPLETQLIVDSREKDVFPLLNEQFIKARELLPIADFLLCAKDSDDIYSVGIERKSIDDLERSIYSSHLDDQIARMSIFDSIILIVEGEIIVHERFSFLMKHLTPFILDPSKSIVFTTSPNSTARFLQQYCKTFNPSMFNTFNRDLLKETAIKKGITSIQAFAGGLMGIPGISKEVACTIAITFQTLQRLNSVLKYSSPRDLAMLPLVDSFQRRQFNSDSKMTTIGIDQALILYRTFAS
eukprot:TRINITY_DN1321_c0_g1_i1.p1 TRINITY_DN1321_c0_g1~~TRINITY_DN1321_c0_g1_i1.p1  ORF type:complete len:492 (-),score=119.83 TRINITY_DN1321_c0_g1_i1:411-1886(-)